MAVNTRYRDPYRVDMYRTGGRRWAERQASCLVGLRSQKDPEIIIAAVLLAVLLSDVLHAAVMLGVIGPGAGCRNEILISMPRHSGLLSLALEVAPTGTYWRAEDQQPITLTHQASTLHVLSVSTKTSSSRVEQVLGMKRIEQPNSLNCSYPNV